MASLVNFLFLNFLLNSFLTFRADSAVTVYETCHFRREIGIEFKASNGDGLIPTHRYMQCEYSVIT